MRFTEFSLWQTGKILLIDSKSIVAVEEKSAGSSLIFLRDCNLWFEVASDIKEVCEKIGERTYENYNF